jgi:hypothetical protein
LTVVAFDLTGEQFIQLGVKAAGNHVAIGRQKVISNLSQIGF